MKDMIAHEFGAPGLFQDDFRKWSRAEWQIVNNLTKVDMDEPAEFGQIDRFSFVLGEEKVDVARPKKQKAQWKRETLGRRS